MKRRCLGSGQEPSAVREGDVDGAICPACGIGQRMGPPGLVAPHSTVVPPVRKRRKALPRFGRKAQREREAIAEFRGAVRERAYGICQVEGFREQMRQVCGTDERHPGAHAHHVFPSDRDAGRHDPERGLWLCATAHAFVHANPAIAQAMGLLGRSSPTSAPRG